MVFSLTLTAAGEVNDRAVVVDRIDGDADQLRRGVAGVVVGGDFDFVDVVAIEVGRRFEVGRGQKRQIARRTVDREEGPRRCRR